MVKTITRDKHANIAWRQNNPALERINYLQFEQYVFGFMDHYCAEYNGGMWEMYTLSNGAFYLAMDKDKTVNIVNPNNYYKGNMSTDAAGICMSIMSIAYLWESEKDEQKREVFNRKYHGLWDYVHQHEEVSQMVRFLD